MLTETKIRLSIEEAKTKIRELAYYRLTGISVCLDTKGNIAEFMVRFDGGNLVVAPSQISTLEFATIETANDRSNTL